MPQLPTPEIITLRGEGVVIEYYREGAGIMYRIRGQGFTTETDRWAGAIEVLLHKLLSPLGLAVAGNSIIQKEDNAHE